MGESSPSFDKTPRRIRIGAAPIVLGVLAVLIAILAALAVWLNPAVSDSAVLEAGGVITMDLFMERHPEEGRFLTDVYSIDTSRPGIYAIDILRDGKTYDCSLIIRDTAAPTASPVHVTVGRGRAPSPEEFVTDVRDVTPVTVVFDGVPDLTAGGDQTVGLILTDTSGNETRLTATLTVLLDSVPPQIHGARDLEGYAMDSLDLTTGVSVTDDEDPSPTLEVDDSGVDPDSPGVYALTYIARDAAGNESRITVNVTILERPVGYVDPRIVMGFAEKALEGIVNDSMDDMDKAYAIYRYVKYTVAFEEDSHKSTWSGAAYQAFAAGVGDSFVHASACRALLTAAGIENVDITGTSGNHWNLVYINGGWYHFDATPRAGGRDNFFLLTDAELEAYSSTHSGSHRFDASLYPDRSETSLQDAVDYGSTVLRR